MLDFRWNAANADHIGKHGVTPDEAEDVVDHARRPYPEYRGDGKYYVCGRGTGGRFVQVIYIVDPDGTLYVIHARPLTPREVSRNRRRQGRRPS